MTHEIFEHTADIGVRGKGKTIEESFQECAKAMFSIMCSVQKVKRMKKVPVKTNGIDETSLLINFLNELLALKDIKGMMFSDFKITIKKAEEYELKGIAVGEPISEKHELKTEVKAATFHQALVKKNKEWTAQCVVDV